MNRAGNRSFQGFVASPKMVVGGLNNGLWIWKENDQVGLEPQRITSIQGRLMSLQLVDEEWVLVLAQMAGGQRYPHWVSLQDPEKKYHLQLQEALQPDRVSAVAYSQGRMILGTESGRIFGISLSVEQMVKDLADSNESHDLISSSNLVEFPRQHFSRIRSLKVHSDGALLSVAEEPLVNLWKPSETPTGFAHEIRLTGTLGNVAEAAFVSSSSHVVAVDEGARSIVWDVVRQRQRQKVERVREDGKTPMQYDASVSSIVHCEGLPHAVSILQNGRVDRWNTQTGQSLHRASVPFAYVGHDPNAQLVDMAIDENAGLMITSARLPSRSGTFRQDMADEEMTAFDPAQSEWEFVKWDLNERTMLDRWNFRAREEQSISLSGRGRYVLYGSDNSTRLGKPSSDSDWEFLREDFHSFFGVVHPHHPNWMMLVKLNGVAMMVDTDQLEGSWKRSGYQLSRSDFSRLATKGDRAIIGRWAPEGDAFYLIWESGRVTELIWLDERLRLGRDLFGREERLDLTMPARDRQNSSELQESLTVRIGSRWSVDMAVRTKAGFHNVYALVRFPGSDGFARLTRIAFPVDGGSTLRDQVESQFGTLPVVLSSDDVPQFAISPMKKLNTRLPNLRSQMMGSRTIGEHCFVATRQGTVYRIGEEGVQVFGRPRLISSTGDRSGNVIVTLHEGGVLWRGQWKDEDWDWKQLETQDPGAEEIAMSPDGTTLWIRSSDSSRLTSAATGRAAAFHPHLDSCVVASWHPGKDSTLMAVNDQGRILQFEGEGVVDLGKLDGRKVQSIHFFHEAWNEPQKEKTPWLALHCQSADGLSHHELVYVKLESDDWIEEVLPLPGKVTAIDCSPTEGLIAIGGQGTVGIYFASPSLGEPGKQLFSLPGHAGSDLVELRFSEGGTTLISADSNYRMFSWLSEDSLSGITEELALASGGLDRRR